MSEDAPITLNEEQQSEVQALLQQGQKIEAVKLCREFMDCDLVEAKKFVDAMNSSKAEPEEAQVASLSPLGIAVLLLILGGYWFIR